MRAFTGLLFVEQLERIVRFKTAEEKRAVMKNAVETGQRTCTSYFWELQRLLLRRPLQYAKDAEEIGIDGLNGFAWNGISLYGRRGNLSLSTSCSGEPICQL